MLVWLASGMSDATVLPPAADAAAPSAKAPAEAPSADTSTAPADAAGPSGTSPPPPDAPLPLLTTQVQKRRNARRAYHGPDEQLDIPPFAIGNAAGVGLPGRTSEVRTLHALGEFVGC